MTPELAAWLPAAVAVLAVIVALLAAARTKKTQRRAAVDANRMDLLWRQVRGVERLDDTQRETLARSLYAQFDPAGVPWDDLDEEDVREMWRHQATRVAAEVAAQFVAHTHRVTR